MRDHYWRVGGNGPLVRVERYERAAEPRYDVFAVMGAAFGGFVVATLLVTLLVTGR